MEPIDLSAILPRLRQTPSVERVEVTLSAAGRTIVVASALAIAQRTLASGEMAGGVRRLRRGERLEIDAFLSELAALGYSIEPVVAEAGQASRRGGIIDVFPPGAELPARIELLGREIDSLRAFDPATQRSVGPVDTIEIGPARELVAPDLSRLRNLDFSRCTAAARERFEDELGNLEAGVVFEGRDFYVPLLAQATLLDHLPEDSLLVLDERADIAAVLDEAHEEAEAARRELEERGEVPRGLPSALEHWPALEKQPAGRPAVLTLSRWATEEAASENAADVVRLPFAGQRAYGGQPKEVRASTFLKDPGGPHPHCGLR